MKIRKSLTLLTAVIALTACASNHSAAFSLSSNETTSSAFSSEKNSSKDESKASSYSSQNVSSNMGSSQSNASISSVAPSSITVSSLTPSSEPVSSVAPSSEPISSEPISSNPVSSSAPISSNPISSSSITSSSAEPVKENYYSGYYDSLVSWENGEDLKNQLHAIIRNGYQPLSYKKSNTQNYDTNVHADRSKYDFEYLDVVYSENHVFKTATNKGWQREHAWCASLMCGSTTGDAVAFKGRATDFHNLFAAEAGGNQSRGNKNYGYAGLMSLSYVDRTIDQGNDGYSFDELTFEPADIDKGRLARAIFYMATMYKDDEFDTANNVTMKGLQIVEDPVPYVAGNNCYFAIGNLIDLLEWNEDTPVDYLEMQHNISVYTDSDNPDGYAQGNRNPYIDYPELVDYVYGDKKDQPGTLKELTASISYLGNEEHTFSHFAIKEAKREYGFGEKLTNNDYSVYAVYHDFTVEDTIAYSSIGNSLNNHVFSEEDGDTIEATITNRINNITYLIVLNPMGLCNSGALAITTTGINKKTPDTDQEVTYGKVPFYFNFSTSYSSVSSSGMTINNISAGGITVGSNSRVLTKLTIKTKDSYTVDSLFIKAMAGNATSSYALIIKVGDDTVYSGTINDSSDWKVFGTSLEREKTGQLAFIFTGSASLKINSIAFNSIIV